jgi:hypothetical protein
MKRDRLAAWRRGHGRSDTATRGERGAVDDALEPLPPLWPDPNIGPRVDQRTVTRRVPNVAATLAVAAALAGVVIIGVGASVDRLTPAERQACFLAGARTGYSTGYTSGYTAALALRDVSPGVLQRWRSADATDIYANVPRAGNALFGRPRCA